LYFDLQPIFIIKTLPSALDAYHGKKNSQIFNSRAVLESNKPKQTKQTTYLPKKPNKTKQTNSPLPALLQPYLSHRSSVHSFQRNGALELR